MKNMISLFIINILIIISLIISLYYKIFYGVLAILIIINIIIIYYKSTEIDKKEKKRKILLHKIKNSLSIILGYSEAYNDNLITKDSLDEKINEEISNIVTIIKEEIYK